MARDSTGTPHSSLPNLELTPARRFSDAHGFVKPNDKPALDLMDRAAQRVFEEVPDVVVGFGESDEYRYRRLVWKAISEADLSCLAF